MYKYKRLLFVWYLLAKEMLKNSPWYVFILGISFGILIALKLIEYGVKHGIDYPFAIYICHSYGMIGY